MVSSSHKFTIEALFGKKKKNGMIRTGDERLEKVFQLRRVCTKLNRTGHNRTELSWDLVGRDQSDPS